MAGLCVGDRVIEVNSFNVETATHAQVVAKIKEDPTQALMLVIDKITDSYLKREGIAVSAALAKLDSVLSLNDSMEEDEKPAVNGDVPHNVTDEAIQEQEEPQQASVEASDTTVDAVDAGSVVVAATPDAPDDIPAQDEAPGPYEDNPEFPEPPPLAPGVEETRENAEINEGDSLEQIEALYDTAGPPPVIAAPAETQQTTSVSSDNVFVADESAEVEVTPEVEETSEAVPSSESALNPEDDPKVPPSDPPPPPPVFEEEATPSEEPVAAPSSVNGDDEQLAEELSTPTEAKSLDSTEEVPSKPVEETPTATPQEEPPKPDEPKDVTPTEPTYETIPDKPVSAPPPQSPPKKRDAPAPPKPAEVPKPEEPAKKSVDKKRGFLGIPKRKQVKEQKTNWKDKAALFNNL